MKFLLSVIAVCLIMITSKLYIPEAQAEVAGMDAFDLKYDYDFSKAVKDIVEDSCLAEGKEWGEMDGSTPYVSISINIKC